MIVFVNRTDWVEPGYSRYLENYLRERTPFTRVPLRIVFKARSSRFHGNEDEQMATTARTKVSAGAVIVAWRRRWRPAIAAQLMGIAGVLIASYLLASISFAWLAGKLNHIDLRQHGSGNLGATNAGRVLGWWWFVAVFALDLGKGLLPVLALRHLVDVTGVAPDQLQSFQMLQIGVGAAAVLGHALLYHRLRGGKAVATSLGVLIGVVPLVAAIGAGVAGLYGFSAG